MQMTRIYDAANEQANCINMIADPEATPELVASCYADCIFAGTGVDWHKINCAILERFGGNAGILIGIKNMAWKEVETGKPAFVE